MSEFESKPGELAMVGIDAAWGGCERSPISSAAAYQQMIYQGTQIFAQPGARPQPGQAAGWLASSAQRAATDAGLKMAGGARLAVLYASDQPVSLHLPWASLALDLSQENNFVPAALDRAVNLLTSYDGVIVAAAGLSEVDWDSVMLAEGTAMGYDRSAHGWRFGWGCGAVVLTSRKRAVLEGMRIYAVIKAWASAPGRSEDSPSLLPVVPSLEDVRSCCRTALEKAGCLPSQIGYVEVLGSGWDALDGAEIAGLCQAYRSNGESAGSPLTSALGSGQANHGYLFAAAGLAGWVRAALCVYHRMIPPVPGWTAPKLPVLWRGAHFYIPVEGRAWFESPGGPGWLAGVNLLGRNGSFAHLILGDAPGQREPAHPALAMGGLLLFPLVGSSLEELTGQLEDLQSSLPYSTDLLADCAEGYEASLEREEQRAQYGVAILGRNHTELLREIDLALKSLSGALEKGADWQTPLGSCFSARPVGQQGSVALVYGGAFSAYPGAGKDLFHLCPWLFEASFWQNNNLAHVIREQQLYPRSLAALTKEEQAEVESRLLADPVAMLTAGSTLAVIFTSILEELFKIKPAAAFGYSLGENSMMYALRVWQEGDAAARRLEESPLFYTRLAGPQSAVREFWHREPVSEPLWNNYLVMAPWETVRQTLENEPRVYMTHINTPRQVVIGGDPEGCQRVIAALRCSSLRAPFDYALHCDPIRSEVQGLAELHRWPIQHVPEVRLYSAVHYAPLELEATPTGSAQLANQIAEMLCSPLDFPRLIQRVYADGARVFIEAGAGSNCARWIDETLKGQPHLALSINRRGTDDYTSLVRLAARLHSHRVPVDLRSLYLPSTQRFIQEEATR